MSEETITYRPRNDKVVVKLEVVEKLRGVHVPQMSLEGQRWLIHAKGPKVENLEIGDEILIGGKMNEDWAFIPGRGDLAITSEANVILVIERTTEGKILQ